MSDGQRRLARATHIYALVLRLYPRGHRRAFGEQMLLLTLGLYATLVAALALFARNRLRSGNRPGWVRLGLVLGGIFSGAHRLFGLSDLLSDLGSSFVNQAFGLWLLEFVAVLALVLVSARGMPDVPSQPSGAAA